MDLSPQKSDFKDSRNPYQDADVVIGLMSPFKLDMTTCLGYNVSKLKKKMIMFKIIKNRLADDGIAAGLYCKPESGSFMELPDPESVLMENYYTHKI